jgi:hypothetical protein
VTSVVEDVQASKSCCGVSCNGASDYSGSKVASVNPFRPSLLALPMSYLVALPPPG